MALCSPFDGDALDVTLADVGGDGRTETLAVTSTVAATGVPDTRVVVLHHGHNGMTGVEHGAVEDIAGKGRPVLPLWVECARVRALLHLCRTR